MQVDLLHALDLAGLDQTAKLGDGLPLFLVVLTAATAAATSTSPTTVTTPAVTTTVATRGETTATGCVSHCRVGSGLRQVGAAAVAAGDDFVSIGRPRCAVLVLFLVVNEEVAKNAPNLLLPLFCAGWGFVVPYCKNCGGQTGWAAPLQTEALNTALHVRQKTQGGKRPPPSGCM